MLSKPFINSHASSLLAGFSLIAPSQTTTFKLLTIAVRSNRTNIFYMLWKILLISSYKHACKTSSWMEKEEWGRNSRRDGPSSTDDKELASKIHHHFKYRISRLISSLHNQTTCTPQRIFITTKRLALNFRELSLPQLSTKFAKMFYSNRSSHITKYLSHLQIQFTANNYHLYLISFPFLIFAQV